MKVLYQNLKVKQVISHCKADSECLLYVGFGRYSY